MNYTSKRPDITLASLRMTLASFRRHIIRSSNNSHSNLSSSFQNFRYSKITNFDGVISCKENILRLQISMDNSATVQVLQTNADLNEPVKDIRFFDFLFLFNLSLQVKIKIANCTQRGFNKQKLTIAVLHYDNELASITVASFVGDDIRTI